MPPSTDADLFDEGWDRLAEISFNDTEEGPDDDDARFEDYEGPEPYEPSPYDGTYSEE